MTQVIRRTRDEVYHLWLNALRSGEYKQARGCLHDEDSYVDDNGDDVYNDEDDKSFVGGFCCLGVLCDLAVKDGGAAWDSQKGPKRSFGEPPEHFLNFMGLDNDMVAELVSMNDDQGMTLEEIADEIESLIMPALDIK